METLTNDCPDFIHQRKTSSQLSDSISNQRQLLLNSLNPSMQQQRDNEQKPLPIEELHLSHYIADHNVGAINPNGVRYGQYDDHFQFNSSQQEVSFFS